MRAIFGKLHRWAGLLTAGFLFFSGITGAIISWDHEIDEVLNHHLFDVTSKGPAIPSIELAKMIEQRDPRARVVHLFVTPEEGHSLWFFVMPRIDPATGKRFAIDYNQIFLDPNTGVELGRRYWGAVWPVTRENFVSFLYKLHYTMHIPEGWGIELGMWLMGLIGIAWVLDTLIALWISLPNWSAWRRSFAFRWKAGGHRLTFDLHRSGGMWVYLLVLMLAVTSVAMNLRNEVMRPLVSLFSELTPSPFASRTPAPLEKPIEPLIPAARALELGRAEAQRRGWERPAGGLFLSTEVGVWGVGFYEVVDSHGDGGLGNPWLYFDSRTGAAAGADLPGTGSAGDIFLQSMFPLHSGRIIGVTGRVLMSITGALVAMLCVTGVLIWARKRRARAATRHAAAAHHNPWSAAPWRL